LADAAAFFAAALAFFASACAFLLRAACFFARATAALSFACQLSAFFFQRFFAFSAADAFAAAILIF